MFLNLDLLIEYPQKGNANNTKSTQRKATEKAKRYSIHWITASHDLWRIGQLLADCRQFLLDDLTTLRQTHQRVRVTLLLLAAFHIVQCRLQHRLHSSTIAAYIPTTERAQERWCRQHCYTEFHLVSWCLTSLFSTNIWLYLCLVGRLDHTGHASLFTGRPRLRCGRSACLEHCAQCDPAVIIARLFQTLTENSFIHSMLLLMLL